MTDEARPERRFLDLRVVESLEAEREKDRDAMRLSLRTCCETDAPADTTQWCEGCKALWFRLEAGDE